ncbi:YfhO family protein [Thalassobacillus sp. B23F22_16]|uniref:YfhO family protein n=1 Tax=Thalassobacillus sp. B23F22_16 TaxID=3459513 RepID=UPI00373EE2AA
MVNKKLMMLVAASLVLAVLAHGFFLQAWTEGRYMVGHNDGLQQMVTFKKLLYHQYTSGNFFYNYGFGLGGGTYSQLSFYFSTSIVFLLSTGVTFLLEWLGVVSAVDIVYWAESAVFISILRLAAILVLTTLVFRYMKIPWLPAFLGSAVYGLSVIYFRHATYWEFFADAMLWLPFLVLGVEKIIREGRAGWFIFAVAVTMIDNFYFAYINLIFIGVYFLFRLFHRLDQQEVSVVEQVRLFVTAGLIGAGISAVSFVPAVYSFLNNYRPDYRFPVGIVDFSDNILFTSRIIVLPAIFLLLLCLIPLYKRPHFRLFASLSVLFVLLHFSPLAASAFNGFSAPQYRWEYLLSFTVGGVVAVGLQYLGEVSKTSIMIASLLVISLYLSVLVIDQHLSFFSLPGLTVLIFMVVIVLMTACVVWIGKRSCFYMLYGASLVFLLVFSNAIQYVISEMTGVRSVSQEFLHSEKYNGKEQRELLAEIYERDSNPFYRIDWRVGYWNNTPIVQNFNGMSVYSSILNKELLFFYLYDLQVDMGRESVSRYSTLGSRANLYSLLQGKYMMRKKEDTAKVPYGFEKVAATENYVMYENTNLLPFVRTTDTVFSKEALREANVLEKEHAMLEGVVVEDGSFSEKPTEAPNLIDNTSMKTTGAEYEHGYLKVKDKEGGIDMIVEDFDGEAGDYYLRFHLESLAERQGFAVKVNGYRTTRKHNQSIYKTYIDDLVIRVPKSEKISIRVPEGEYLLKEFALYEEDYTVLDKAKRHADDGAQVKWEGNNLVIQYDNPGGEKWMVLPIPYERGWQVKVNGEEQKMEKVNYAFLGFPIEPGNNKIQLMYLPPFFKASMAVTFVSTLLALLLVRRKANNKHHLINYVRIYH